MEGEGVRVDLNVPPLGVGDEDTGRAPAGFSARIAARTRRGTHLSVAIWSFAIEVRSSWLVAADMLVRGVLTELPPLTEPVGVDVLVDASVPLFFADCFAAFSARRFCFDAEGAMMQCF